MLLWIGFALAVALLLVVSRKDLALAMGLAALVLGAFTLTAGDLGGALWRTISDPSVLLLTLIVALIPIIGGALEVSGEMDRLVENLRIGVRPFLALSPALLGLLPMPGGALLSAPMIERGAPQTPADLKAAANIWFRHILLLVYPLAPSLIASAKIAELDVYAVIPYLAPAFLLCLVLGYVFLLRSAPGRRAPGGPFSPAGLLVPLAVILAAPVLDLVLRSVHEFTLTEIPTTVGVAASLALALAVGRIRPSGVARIVRTMKPWKYALIIVAMFAFLNVFIASGAPERVAALDLPPAVLCIVIGFLLGMVTGRIQAPISVVVPIFVSAHGAMSAPGFAATYFAVFLGYVLTPIHPCVSVSVAYFATTAGAFFRRLAVPTLIAAAGSLVAGLFVL